MSPILQSLGIDQMSVPDRIALAREILASIAADLPPAELSEAKKQELRRRAAEDDADPDDAIPWEQIKAEALARFRR